MFLPLISSLTVCCNHKSCHRTSRHTIQMHDRILLCSTHNVNLHVYTPIFSWLYVIIIRRRKVSLQSFYGYCVFKLDSICTQNFHLCIKETPTLLWEDTLQLFTKKSNSIWSWSFDYMNITIYFVIYNSARYFAISPCSEVRGGVVFTFSLNKKIPFYFVVTLMLFLTCIHFLNRCYFSFTKCAHNNSYVSTNL